MSGLPAKIRGMKSMPDLNSQMTNARAAKKEVMPLMQFAVKNASSEGVRSILLRPQIQIQPPQRLYAFKCAGGDAARERAIERLSAEVAGRGRGVPEAVA